MSTQETSFDPEDPRLTAYALGELTDPAERAQVERLLAASPEACAELADIRALAAALTAEYEQERAVATAAGEPPANVVPMPVAAPRSRMSRLAPWLSLAAVLLVIATVAGIALPGFHSGQVRSQKPAGPVAAIHNDARIADDKTAPATAVPAGPLFAQTTATVAAKEGLALNEPVTLSLPAAPPPVAAKPAVTGASGELASDEEVGRMASANGSDAFRGALTAPIDFARQGNGRVAEKAASAPAALPGANTYTGTTLLDGRRLVAQSESSLSLPVGGMFGSDQSSLKSPPQGSKKFSAAYAGAIATNSRGRASLYSEKDTATANPGAPDAPDLDEPDTRSDRRLRRDKADQPSNTAEYVRTVENPFLGAGENPLSTFSVDVDTASYSIVRRFIESGSLPPPDAVRVEEMLNYFPSSDAPPAPDGDKPFAVHLEAAACPWNPAHRLVRIGLKGKEIDADKRPASNLVFLLDVSGSMMPEERLPLIKKSLHLLVERLREDDHVAIVVYAGESGLALPSTSGDHKDAILHAIDNLHAGGSTNGASGVKLAYNVARKGFIKGGTNRVILATDGDFNVGVTSHGELLRLIERERRDGVFLSVLGVGTDNLKDSTMQTLADHGNGNYAYLDRLEEGRKVLVEQMSGTLVTIAKDVKIQVEFNPSAVGSYRLVGYEKRLLRKEDFNDDRVDAGEIGAGHSVTALYEIVPAGQAAPGPEAAAAVDALKYQPAPSPVRAAAAVAATPAAGARELLTVKLRHKAPDGDRSERSYEVPLVDDGTPGEYANASPDFKFAAAVASFGLILRDSPYKGSATLGGALELAQMGRGEDPGAHRAGFIELVRQAARLQDRER